MKELQQRLSHTLTASRARDEFDNHNEKVCGTSETTADLFLLSTLSDSAYGFDGGLG